MASLVFSSNALPGLAKYLVMLATMGWMARLCDSAAQRWAWLVLVGLLALGVGLEGECLVAAVATGPRSGTASSGFNAQAGTPSKIKLP